jgi:hypothetical protein
LDRRADDADLCAGEHRVEGGGELAVPIADQELEVLGALAELDQEVADLLGHPVGFQNSGRGADLRR